MRSIRLFLKIWKNDDYKNPAASEANQGQGSSIENIGAFEGREHRNAKHRRWVKNAFTEDKWTDLI
jgi:hypothetical protein